MKKYRDKITGKRIVEVDDLSFLSDRHHRYNWLQTHYQSFRHKRACRKADVVVVLNEEVATDVVRYYFVPKSKITIGVCSSAPRKYSKAFQRIRGWRRRF